MQNPAFIVDCVNEINRVYSNLEIIYGDKYHPVLAVKILNFELPENIQPRLLDITIALPRCAGYLPGSSIAGLHLSDMPTGVFEGNETVIPFCDPVLDNKWMLNSARFYPYYQNFSQEMVGTAYLCLNDPQGQPSTPMRLMEVAIDYFNHWQQHSAALAKYHGEIAKGDKSDNSQISKDWITHMVQHVSPKVKQKLLSIAYS